MSIDTSHVPLSLEHLVDEFRLLEDELLDLVDREQGAQAGVQDASLASDLTALQVRLQALTAQAEAKGPQLHGWLRRLTTLAQAAQAEADRVARWARVRTNAAERAKALIKDCLEQAQLLRLEGPTWRLRVQANGGSTPIEWDGQTRPPLACAKSVTVEPAKVVEFIRELLGEQSAEHTDAELLAGVGILDLHPSPTRVLGWVKAHDGELPPGFTLGERGTHLRVE